MTYCNEKQMPCEWAQIGGGCSVSACRKTLLMPGGGEFPFLRSLGRVELTVTNADRLNAMSIEEKAQFLHSIAYAGETPWSKPFYEKFCKDCPAPEYTLDDRRKLCLHECEFADGKCPHGSDAVWWLQQPAEEDTVSEKCTSIEVQHERR